jgi:prevent-host-death family protein
MVSLTVSEARASLPALLDRVEAGEEVTITRHGKPVAVLLAPQALRARSRSRAFELAAQLRQDLEGARDQPIETVKGLSPERADEIVAQLRADRDARG